MDSSPPYCPIFIQAGGQSRRYGSNKARLSLRGEPLISHVAQRIQAYAKPLLVVGHQEHQYDDLGFQTLCDMQPHQGPLGGLQTALHYLVEHTDAEWCAQVSCDMAGIQGDWLRLLWDARTSDARAVAFGKEPWDPLFALYHRELLPIVTQRLEDGQRAMWRLLESIPAVAVPHPDNWHAMRSINTPEDLQAFLAQES